MSWYVPTTGAGAPVFTQLRLSDALSGTPEDPNSVFNSVTEDAAGWAVEIQGSGFDGIGEGCWFRFNMPATWRGDGTQALKVRFSEVTNNGGDWWAAAGIMDKGGIAASSPCGIAVGLRLNPGLNRLSLAMETNAGGATFVGGTAIITGSGLCVPGGPDDATGTTGTCTVSANAGDAFWRAGCWVDAPATINVGVKVMVLGFATATDSSGGAITGKAKFEVAVIELDAAGVFP